VSSVSAGLRAHLLRGGLIAYPTESCYGLGCDPRNPHALKRLIRLKGRSASKGLLLIAHHFKQFKPFILPLSATDQTKMQRSWPGPVTWVVPASPACSPRCLSHPEPPVRTMIRRRSPR